MKFEIERYLSVNMDSNESKSAEETLIEFITTFQKWARDCHNYVKVDRNRLNELTPKGSEARKAMKRIFKHYCTSKNRQYHRSSVGYFFYGGTYDAYPEIEEIHLISKDKAELVTKKIKNRYPALKYTLLKQGKSWKVDSVQRSNGNDKWAFEII